MGSVGQKFIYDFGWHADQRDRPKIIRCLWIIIFRNEGDESTVDGFKIDFFILEVLNQTIEAFLNNVPRYMLGDRSVYMHVCVRSK